MSRWEFLTVADELHVTALAVAQHFDALGYAVVAEARDLGYPFTPTLRCKRQSTTAFVEISDVPDLSRLAEWSAYGRSCRNDTRVYVGLPDGVTVAVKTTMTLKKLGIGVLHRTDGDAISELASPQDLALTVELPDTSKDPKRLKIILGPVYEHYARNQWREGFEEGCVALEAAARGYLWKALESGRVQVMTDAGNVKTMTKAKVYKMTMGQLAKDFANLQPQNHADNVIGSTLSQLNQDRIRVAHKKRTAPAERALRANVGGQMWRIVGALREIYK